MQLMGGVDFPSSRLIPERKGNGAALQSSMLNLINRSEIYFDCVTIIPSKYCDISNTKNCFRIPKSLILNASWRAVFMKAIEASVLPVIKISSTYNTMIRILPSYFWKYTLWSYFHLRKFCESRKGSILAYPDLGACFNPYNDFYNLHTKEWYDVYPSGLFMYISSFRSPWRKTLLTSMRCTWSRRILVATRLFHLDPHHCFLQFSCFLNSSIIYYFWRFSAPKIS